MVIGSGDRIAEVRADTRGRLESVPFLYDGPGTVLPGLIDAHVHLGGIQDPAEPSPILAMLRASPELFAMWVARDARVTLEAGFTTVRDCGGRFVRAVCAVRDAIRLELCPGPRIVVGGWLSQTGGHLDRQMTGLIDVVASGVADGPDAVRRAARERLREGADFVKVCASNSPIADGHLPPQDEYTAEELRAAAEEAHAKGALVAAHAESDTAIARCLEAGVDTIEHGTFLTADTAARMSAQGTILVPTLGVFPALVERLPRWLMKLSSAESRHVLEQHLESFRVARAAGVRIAMGSDTWRCLPHGENAAEIELLVRHGMSPMEAIEAATRVAAAAVGLGGELGVIAPGRLADLLVIDGNPLDDIGVLRAKDRIRLVTRGGRCVGGGQA
jgi:imidazolonepropionase-like amidohydrolase